MNRREFLECAALLVAGVSASQAGFSLSSEQLTYLASAPDYTSRKVNYLNQSQRKIIAAITEVIIPRTDTPGAIDAGVPQFIELMAADWFNSEEKAIFQMGLNDMESRIPREFGKPFDQLDSRQQLAILEAMEAAASDSSWFRRDNYRQAFVSDAPFICQMKELTVWGFFSSKVGGGQVLRYNPMPMRFDGDVPLSPEDSSWASYRF